MEFRRGVGRLSTHVRPLSSETVRPGATGNEYKSGDSRKGTSLALPLRCMRATEYLRGPLREKRVEATVYLRGSLRPQCGSTGRKGGTTLSAFEALGKRLSQKVSMFFNL